MRALTFVFGLSVLLLGQPSKGRLSIKDHDGIQLQWNFTTVGSSTGEGKINLALGGTRTKPCDIAAVAICDTYHQSSNCSYSALNISTGELLYNFSLPGGELPLYVKKTFLSTDGPDVAPVLFYNDYGYGNFAYRPTASGKGHMWSKPVMGLSSLRAAGDYFTTGHEHLTWPPHQREFFNLTGNSIATGEQLWENGPTKSSGNIGLQYLVTPQAAVFSVGQFSGLQGLYLKNGSFFANNTWLNKVDPGFWNCYQGGRAVSLSGGDNQNNKVACCGRSDDTYRAAFVADMVKGETLFSVPMSHDTTGSCDSNEVGRQESEIVPVSWTSHNSSSSEKKAIAVTVTFRNYFTSPHETEHAAILLLDQETGERLAYWSYNNTIRANSSLGMNTHSKLQWTQMCQAGDYVVVVESKQTYESGYHNVSRLLAFPLPGTAAADTLHTGGGFKSLDLEMTGGNEGFRNVLAGNLVCTVSEEGRGQVVLSMSREIYRGHHNSYNSMNGGWVAGFSL